MGCSVDTWGPSLWSAYLCLHHCRALCAEGLHGLEHVNHTLVPHALQDNAQGDEHTGAAHTSTAQRMAVSGRSPAPLTQSTSRAFGTTVHPPLSMGTVPPAVHSDGPILSKLLLCLVHLPDEVDEAFTCFGYSLLWPVCKLELSDCP